MASEDDYAMDFEDTDEISKVQQVDSGADPSDDIKDTGDGTQYANDGTKPVANSHKLSESSQEEASSSKQPEAKRPADSTQDPGQEPRLISLDNFNPLSHHKRLTSPRSIAVCKNNGILPEALFHHSYKDIKGRI